MNRLTLAIRSSIILRDHIWSKTRLIANLIATWGIIYASLHNDGLSEYQLSLPSHRTCYYKQEMRWGRRWGIVSQLQQQPALHLYSVLSWLLFYSACITRHTQTVSGRIKDNTVLFSLRDMISRFAFVTVQAVRVARYKFTYLLTWLPPFLSSPARQSSLTAAHWPTNSHKRVSDIWLQGD